MKHRWIARFARDRVESFQRCGKQGPRGDLVAAGLQGARRCDLRRGKLNLRVDVGRIRGGDFPEQVQRDANLRDGLFPAAAGGERVRECQAGDGQTAAYLDVGRIPGDQFRQRLPTLQLQGQRGPEITVPLGEPAAPRLAAA